MNHILYLSDYQRVCKDPERLGTAFVSTQNHSDFSCKECTELLTAHNDRELKFERDLKKYTVNPVPTRIFNCLFLLLVGCNVYLLTWLVWIR